MNAKSGKKVSNHFCASVYNIIDSKIGHKWWHKFHEIKLKFRHIFGVNNNETVLTYYHHWYSRNGCITSSTHAFQPNRKIVAHFRHTAILLNDFRVFEHLVTLLHESVSFSYVTKASTSVSPLSSPIDNIIKQFMVGKCGWFENPCCTLPHNHSMHELSSAFMVAVSFFSCVVYKMARQSNGFNSNVRFKSYMIQNYCKHVKSPIFYGHNQNVVTNSTQNSREKTYAMGILG